MPINIRGNQYLKVVERLDSFRSDHSIDDGWSIKTEVVHRDNEFCAVIAAIIDPQGKTIATGIAEERRNEGLVNKTSALENAETSAVGRALSFAGYPGSEIASADEVSMALEQQGTPIVLNDAGKRLTAVVEEVDDWRAVVIHFGKNKGKSLRELTERQLSWYQTKWSPTKDKDGNTLDRPPSEDDLLLRAALDSSIEEDHQVAQSMQDEVPF
jgi:hypothetical protein